MSINTVMIEGRVGGEPRHHIFGNGGQVCSFSLAHNQYWTDKKGETKTKVVWIEVKAFDKLAEFLRDKCSKGQRVILTGSLDFSSWTDKDTGKNNSRVELLVKNVRFLNSTSSSISKENEDDLASGSSNQGTNESLEARGYEVFTAVDIPF